MLLGIGLASTIKSIRQPGLGFNVSLTERTLEERKEKDVVYLCRRKPRLLVYVKFLCLLFSQLYFTQVQMFAALFLLFSLASSLVVTSLFRFKMKRTFGIYLFFLYIVFLIVVILAEIPVFKITINGVLHPVAN